MTNLSALLENRGIRKAVVIDDVYDEAPRPDELHEGDWSIFFDDLDEAGNALLEELYPAYEETNSDDLKGSLEFIRVLWDNRERLPTTAREHLFNDYENAEATQRAALDNLVAALETFGLTCIPLGTDFSEDAKEADLIFVDLFLGLHQSQGDIERAIRLVSELVRNRADNPPLVVLMSRSSRLWEKRNEFRDSAGLLGSTFRFVIKAELTKPGKLEAILTRLADHYEDAKRVAAFVHAWEVGLKQAHKNFIRILRRLDLSDFAQVRALLLDFEGQLLGEYLLDVADRVLQHEIEAEAGTITAAQELNKIELAKYPAPHLAGSPDLQDLVHRMVFQNAERLKLSFESETPTIQYGDVLQRKDENSDALTNDVFLVATPACDLARSGTEYVLVLPGTLKSLAAADWSYESNITKTPIFASEDGSRYWIEWHLKRRQTIKLACLRQELQIGRKFERLGRIRDIYATEIQQRLLADMGRIGQPANPPATFPVSISLFVMAPNATALPIAGDESDAAVCFVGRDSEGNRVDHLVLREEVCDALRGMILDYPPDDVHTLARPSLVAMKTDTGFFERFERGLIEVPLKDGKWQQEKGAENKVYFHIIRNEEIAEGYSPSGSQRNAPFVLRVLDLHSQGDN